jgi:hypothetical protein
MEGIQGVFPLCQLKEVDRSSVLPYCPHNPVTNPAEADISSVSPKTAKPVENVSVKVLPSEETTTPEDHVEVVTIDKRYGFTSVT